MVQVTAAVATASLVLRAQEPALEQDRQAAAMDLVMLVHQGAEPTLGMGRALEPIALRLERPVVKLDLAAMEPLEQEQLAVEMDTWVPEPQEPEAVPRRVQADPVVVPAETDHKRQKKLSPIFFIF